MRNGKLIIGAVGALVVATGVGAMISSSNSNATKAEGETPKLVSAVKEEPKDCRVVATNETGFDPATTPVPVREDAGKKQVLKGTAVGAAVGAVAGEVIGGKPGIGAAAGAGDAVALAEAHVEVLGVALILEPPQVQRQ